MTTEHDTGMYSNPMVLNISFDRYTQSNNRHKNVTQGHHLRKKLNYHLFFYHFYLLLTYKIVPQNRENKLLLRPNLANNFLIHFGVKNRCT